MKISWTEIRFNKEVLNLVQEPRQITKMIKTRKFKFFGLVVRHKTFIKNIMEGRINRKRGRVRLKDINLGNAKKLFSLPSYEAVTILTGKRAFALDAPSMSVDRVRFLEAGEVFLMDSQLTRPRSRLGRDHAV